jgi:transcription-repair coupling factor (superfamily II helicase)
MQSINDLDREYFVLEYAGRDKIYVPVELADRIDKYIGGEHPELQKLSGASWTTALVAVQEDVAKVAQELLDVYARRTTATAHHMLPQKEEQHLDDACPYDLTVDQQDALQNIFDDMMKDQPMDRLLCGDVGFGKTEVALRASFRAVLNGYQVAVLAPTTILTQQHFDTFTERFKDLGVSVGALSRFQSPAQQKETIARIAAGTVDAVVGTHRIFSSDVQFKKLGLIVIDEEQRFGVKAKETLTSLRSSAHVLTMTATPIPRTLHLSLSGVRAISTILTPPEARKAVELTIAPLNTEIIQEAVARERARGGQVYYVYNRVQSIERRKLELQALLGENVRISVAHGQMPPKALSDVMHAFDTGQIDVLLSSSIVENGLDVATANTMIVENAAMFGLAELYQLKGRVGRAREQGYAYFLYKEQQLAGDVKERFLALQAASGLGDGFELAMRDMEIRGVGNMLGKAQHGHASKIGLHLYVRLLNTAVQQLQGKNTEPLREVNIDLPLEGRIPEDLIPDTAERIQLYQQLANCTDLTELSDAKKDLMNYELLWSDDALVPEITGLMQLLEMKILASRSTLTNITTDYPTTSNRLASERITITTSEPLPDLPPEWERIYERSHMAFKARASLDQLGDQWLAKLKQVIELCSTTL